MTRTLIANDPTLVEPLIAKEGESPVFAVRVPDVTTGVTGTPTVTYYKVGSGTNLVATYVSTANCTVSGTDVIVTGTFQNLKAGFWVWDILATVDGISRIVVTVPFIVKRRSEL